MFVQRYISQLQNQPLVRPWALSGPILILLICLPLLRPLQHPGQRWMSEGEASTLATVQSLVEHKTLAIDDSDYANIQERIAIHGRHYSSQPPVQGTLLGGCYWVMRRLGLSLARDSILVTYLLTLIGVTLPVALSAGLVYRMGRLLELKRPLRAALGAVVVLGSGLASDAVALNPHAPAAAMILASATCLVCMTLAMSWLRCWGWILGAGFFAALAAVTDPPAAVFLPLLAIVVLAMRWRTDFRFGGVLLYALGAIPPLALHTALVLPVTGDLLPGKYHPELADRSPRMVASGKVLSIMPANLGDIDEDDRKDLSSAELAWLTLGHGIGRVLTVLAGERGLFSHFPILLIAAAGLATVLRRHWPVTTKALAAVTLMASTIIVGVYGFHGSAWSDAAFGATSFIVFLPLATFWSGAWMRRPHHPLAWGLAALALATSITVSFLGMTQPFLDNGYDDYRYVAQSAQVRPPSPAVTKALKD